MHKQIDGQIQVSFVKPNRCGQSCDLIIIIIIISDNGAFLRLSKEKCE